MSFSASRHTSGVMQLLYDSTNLCMDSSSLSFTFDGGEGEGRPGFYRVNATEAAWQIMKLLAMETDPMLMSIPVSDESISSHISDDESEAPHAETNESFIATEETGDDDDEESMLPTILGGVVMVTALALDMTGII